jgi:gluconolactonase
MQKLVPRLCWMFATAWVGCSSADNQTPTMMQASGTGTAAVGAAGMSAAIAGAVGASGTGAAAVSGGGTAGSAAFGAAGMPVISGMAGAAGMSGAAGMPVVMAGGVGASAGSGAPAAGSGGSNTGPVMPQDYPPLTAAQFGTPKMIANTFMLAEGPVWDACNNRLLFVDVNNRKIHTFAIGGTVGVYVDGTNWANGMVFDPDGMKIEVLIDHNPMGGKLQTTDDLVLRSDGTIYFTDPIISHGPYMNDVGSLSVQSVYQLKPGTMNREVVKVGQATLPNGIKLSPDEKTLYVAGFIDNKIEKYTVAADGSISGMTDFATGVSSPDSMCMDAAGNLYVGVKTGLQIIKADGTKVMLIPITTTKGVTNCGFGGPDGKTLFITGWNVLMQLDNVPIPGNDWRINQRIKC